MNVVLYLVSILYNGKIMCSSGVGTLAEGIFGSV